MTNQTATTPVSNSVAAADDILYRLQVIIATTPRYNLIALPISRNLLAEAAEEIERLRSENIALLTRSQ